MSDSNNINIEALKNKIVEELAEKDSDSTDKTMDDLPQLVLDQEYDTCIKVICEAATMIKFTIKSKHKRKRGLERLKGHLSNVQSEARAYNEANGLRQEFKQAWKLVFDNGR